MTKYIFRRLLTAIPTLLAISFVLFAVLELSPADPVGGLPLTIPPEVREQIRESLGVNRPFFEKYLLWLQQFLINEPLNILFESTGGVDEETGEIVGVCIGDCLNRLRILSWQTRSPVIDLVMLKMPQTLWVVGTSYVWGILIAIPIGVISAYKQYSIFDQVATFAAMIGFSVPTFFTGLMFIIIFSVWLKGPDGNPLFPSVYNTTLVVNDFDSFVQQLRQMFMPVLVLTLFYTAQLSRYTRSAMLDNLNQDYIRTARSKGLGERKVVVGHALRNSMIPVVTLIALGIPGVFQGAIITEQIFKINGLGSQLILSIQGGDLPTVQTLTFIFAVLIVLFNIVADVVYGFLDPRVRYD